MRSARTAGCGIAQLWQREVGGVSSRCFARRLAASEDLILRLGIHKKLDMHRGCVNTVSFSSDGDILVSGSDDRMVMLWDWEVGRMTLSFHSGHTGNVFQALFMPYSDDRTIITCAADGEVRHAHILEGGQVATTSLGQHEGWAYKMAIDPGSPHIFYSCGEDGLVQHFDLRTRTATKLFICQSFHDKLWMPIIHLNAIAIDPRNPNLFAIAGSDEYARLYDMRKYRWNGPSDFGHPTDYFCPPDLIREEVVIAGLAFSDQSELLVSYNDELIYLFTRDQGLGPNPVPGSPRSSMDTCSGDILPSSSAAETNPRPGLQVYGGHQNCATLKGVSFLGPSSEYVTSGSDCGRIFIWRKKDGELLRVMEGDKCVVNCIEPHPYSTVLASSGIENDVKIWLPIAMERAPCVNMDEGVLMLDGIDCFAIDEPDYCLRDGDDTSDDDNDVDDDDGDFNYDNDGDDDDFDDDDDDDVCDNSDSGTDDMVCMVLSPKT